MFGTSQKFILKNENPRMKRGFCVCTNVRVVYPNLPVLEEFRMCALVEEKAVSTPEYQHIRSMGSRVCHVRRVSKSR